MNDKKSPADVRRRDEGALLESETHYRTLFENVPVGIGVADAAGNLVAYNSAILEPGGYSREDVQRIGSVAALYYHPEQRGEILALFAQQGVLKNYPVQLKRKDGSPYDVLLSLTPTTFNGQVCTQAMVEDITARKKAEAENAKLEAQLHQAQKLKSVGHLAGGVAHEFNNMLSVVLGHTEMALEGVSRTKPLYADLQEIHKAASRSADLVRQLLAFAGRQTIAPRVMDLNVTVTGALAMLERLIGEDIRVQWQPAADLWPVKVDPSQIEQMLAALCLNARDASAGVGRITIATSNAADGDAQADAAGVTPGEYVRLVVGDDGSGRDHETLAHIFEPFFSTKDVGQSNGLGLATVYGAAKQNGGFIQAHSEPGSGTTFTIYLPRHAAKVEQRGAEGAAGAIMGGHETILLAEDDLSVLTLTTVMLERQGYTVLAASTPGEAIRLAKQHAGHIHLLMTDIVMPEMSGWVLARNLLSLYPHLKRLFMSGWTADVVAQHGVVGGAVHFLQKPFSKRELAAALREALDGESGERS